MTWTLGELARSIGGDLTGDSARLVGGLRSLEAAGPDDITVLTNSRYAALAAKSRAGAIVIATTASLPVANVIRVEDPKRAFLTLIRMFSPEQLRTTGAGARAVVHPSVIAGIDVSIGVGAVIEEHARLGDRVSIGANTVIGRDCVIGEESEIGPNVTIYERTSIGRRVIVHAGAVIGSDGFSYIENPDGTREKIPQLGSVEIGDDVEIGANCTIDRATLEKTVIGRGTKIDNLVQIGHNTIIGEDVCIVAQAGVSGSVRIGSRALLAGQAGIADHVTIGDGVMVAAQAGVHSDLPSGVWIGTPALPYEKGARLYATIGHFPEYRERVRALETELAKAQQRIADLELRREGFATADAESKDADARD